jgi:hypothetical protein
VTIANDVVTRGGGAIAAGIGVPRMADDNGDGGDGIGAATSATRSSVSAAREGPGTTTS